MFVIVNQLDLVSEIQLEGAPIALLHSAIS
jgi:hypothetical protein